jgi:hypothetical protein
MIEVLLQAERLLVHGMVDQAEEMYRRVAEQDPQNAIATVGLARVALERGDEGLAYEHACAALEIDRENVAALRLEARLSEVFATRGAPVQRPAWLDTGKPPPPPPPPRPPPAESGAPATETARPSERHVLTHNPSMADHRQREEQSAPPAPPATDAEPPAKTRPGLLRRLLGQ